MSAEKVKFDIDLGVDAGRISIRSYSQALDFIHQELAFWDWVPGGGPPYVSERLQALLAPLRNFRQASEEAQEHWTEGMGEACSTVFSGNRVPLSKSRLGLFFQSLSEESVDVAQAALAHHLNVSGLQLDRAAHVRGCVAYSLFMEGVSRKLPLAVEAQLVEAIDKYTRETQRIRDAFEGEVENIQSDHSNARNAFARSIKMFRSRVAKKGVSIERRTNSAIGEINQTRVTFEEFMRLKAPVQYWEEKARKHRLAREELAKVLIAFSIVATFALGFGLYWLAEHVLAVAKDEPSTHAYLVFATLGVVATTIVFWIARVLTRLFLSQHHLEIDSEERATMVQTYLALTATNMASPDERAIVLNSLFRPTTDGIVKDDGAPDLGPSALLSRLVQR